MEKYTGLEIAVIGLSGRFPEAENITQYWENLISGKDCIANFNDIELLEEGESEALLKDPSYVKSNAYVRNKEFFDSAFFNYTPDEAELMDPQVRIYHECCWEALEDSGYSVSGYTDKISVFASGTPNVPWVLHSLIKNRDGLVDDFTASHLRDVSFLSSRVSYKLNLKGPAVFVQTACSSSLVAIHEACNSLLLRECAMALAGGINIQNHSKKGYLYQEGMIRSRDGKCRPFDADSSGTVGGEGAGVVVLKRLKDAIRDRDHIYAIIKGTAINNDGSNKVGYTAPSVLGQAEAIRQAHKMAGIAPNSISYVETHGTATELGDTIEIEALNKAFGLKNERRCAIGAVKSNIGHLDSAAGVAGFIKTVLAIKNKQIPPTLHFNKPNPKIEFDNGHFYVVDALTKWENDEGPLRAGVSAFGIGGTNAHVVLEEAPLIGPSTESRDHQLIVLSGKTKASLERNSALLLDYLKNNRATNLPDITSVLQNGRDRFKYRKVLVCDGIDEAIERLTANEMIEGEGRSMQEDLQNIIFAFPGQGAQYTEMCKDLYFHERLFKRKVDECFSLAKLYSEVDFSSILFPKNEAEFNDRDAIKNTRYAQPLLFIIEYSLAQLFLSWGVKPNYMIGHSIGEYTAACLSSVLSLSDALRLVIRRAELMSQVESGGMLSIDISKTQLNAFLNAELGKQLDLAVVNSENSFVVSGAEVDIAELEKEVSCGGYPSKRIHTSHAFHSHMMDDILAAFEAEVSCVKINEPEIPYISNISGEFVTYDQIKEVSYWSSHLRNTVDFLKGTETLLKMGNACIIEIGPGRTLCNYIAQHQLKNEQHHLISTVRQSKQRVSDQKYLLEKLGLLWLNGIKIDWDGFYIDEERNKISLPSYSFDRLSYTTNFDVNGLLNNRFQYDHSLYESNSENYVNVTNWKRSVSPNRAVELDDNHLVFLVFSGKESAAEFLISHLFSQGQKVIEVRSASSFKRISDELFEVNVTAADDVQQLWEHLRNRGTVITNIIYTLTLDEDFTSVDYGDIGAKLDSGYLGLCYLAQSIVHMKLNLTVVSNYLANVTAQDIIDPLKAAVHAPARIIPSEISTLSCKVIDIPYPFKNQHEELKYLPKIVNEIFYEDEEPFVAYRFEERWVQCFESTRLSDKIKSNVEIVSNGLYIVTGGFGGMGFAVANDLVHRHGAKVILVYRSYFPERVDWTNWLHTHGSEDEVSKKILQIISMERLGNQVGLYQVDLSSEEEVKQFVTDIKKQYSKINGLIWAAGEVDYGGIMLNRTKDDFIKYTTSKIHGLLLFEKYLTFENLDFLGLFSSIGNDFYQIKFGQVAYNAANEFLEAYALYAKTKWNIHAFAINWCDWLDVGMTIKTLMKEIGTENIGVLNSKVSKGIYPKEGMDVFYKCLQYKGSVYTIYKGDVAKAFKSYQLQLNEINRNLKLTHQQPDPTLNTTVNLEERLIEIFSVFFGKEDVNPKDDFFELGGDSLKAMTLIGRINKAIGVNLSISDIYRYPTISELQNELSNQTLNITNKAIPKVVLKEHYPLSSEQKRMYFLQVFDIESTAYNETELLWVAEKLNKSKVEDIFNTLIKRHEILRTFFEVEHEEPKQRVMEEFNFSVAYLSASEDTFEEVIQSFIRPFDLSKAPLYRVGVLERGPEEYLIVMDSHHIVLDGASKDLLIRDFKALYHNEELPVLGLQYKEYAEWQQSEEQQKARAKDKLFWISEFLTIPEKLELPTDFPRSLSQIHPGDCFTFELSVEETSKLREIANIKGTTLFVVLLSVYNVLLAKLSNQDDIVIGVPVAGRQHADFEHTVGMFVNTLALRNYPKGDLKFDEFLEDLKSRTLACLDHQSCQFEELIDELKVERDLSRNPLFDVMFVFQKIEKSIPETSDPIFRRNVSRHTSSKFDVTLSAVEANEQIHLSFVYASDLFRREILERMGGYFRRIVSHIVENLCVRIVDIEILSEEEKTQILFDFNDTKVEYPRDETILSLFEKQVIKTPEKIALVNDGDRISYKELSERAETIAHRILERTASGQHKIGLLFKPGVTMIASILGILKAGCAYVPLSPNVPDERNRYILKDCNAFLLLVQDELQDEKYARGGLIAEEKVVVIGKRQDVVDEPELPKRIISSNELVYVIYTSGTTGQPKGVEIKHTSLVNYISWRISNHNFTTEDVTLQLVSYHFDGFGADLYPPLLSGGSVVIISEEQRLNTDHIIEVIRTEKITNVSSPPGLYGAILDKLITDNSSITLRFVVLAGERAHKGLIQKSKLILPEVSLGNEYGPTESTIGATHNKILTQDNNSIIGKPIQNTRIYILGRNNELLPLGVSGELCISGEGLANGYVNNQQLTGEKFVTNPFVPDTLMYKTGDMGRWLADGNIEILGRIDDQVKIRGFRIELGEIESKLTSHPEVRESIVVAREIRAERYLVAYYLSDKEMESALLMDFLSEKLPDYMIPVYYVHLKRFPYTAIGKLDRKTLPLPEIKASEHHVAPTTNEECLLVEIWEQVLGIENIGITDNFFSVGGDSIKSIQISSRIRSAGYAVFVKDIFNAQTIRELALRMKTIVAISDQSTVRGNVPLTPIQKWFFKGFVLNKNHFNQSVVLEFTEEVAEQTVTLMFKKLQEHHDALRMIFRMEEGIIIQENLGTDLAVSLELFDLKNEKAPQASFSHHSRRIHSSIELKKGPLMKLCLFHRNQGSQLLIVVHHLVIDGISWRILFEDIERLYQQIKKNEPLSLALKTDSFQSWSMHLLDYIKCEKFKKVKAYWNLISDQKIVPIKRDHVVGAIRANDPASAVFYLNKAVTKSLLKEAHLPFNTQINDILLTALLLSIKNQFGNDAVKVDMEGHGREDLFPNLNVSRTVGWFTSIYPVILRHDTDQLSDLIKGVKESLRAVPNNGLDYLLQKYSDDYIKEAYTTQINFNYLGQFDSDIENKPYKIVNESNGHHISSEELSDYDWEISGMISNGELSISLKYNKSQYAENTISMFQRSFKEKLEHIIGFCANHNKRELTPSDLTYKEMSVAKLDELQLKFELEDVYPLSPMQEGMLFHCLLNPDSAHYFEQVTCRLEGIFDVLSIEQSMNDLILRYDVFRTVFLHHGYERPLQMVLKSRNIDFSYVDIRKECLQGSREKIVQYYQQKDRARKFNLNQDVLLRLSVLQTNDCEYEFIWSFHHILMDGWCMSTIIGDFNSFYLKNRKVKELSLPAVKKYSNYIEWLEEKDKTESAHYWKAYLDDYFSPVTLPKKEINLIHDLPFVLSSKQLFLHREHVRLLHKVSEKYGVTQNTIFQLAWGVLLARYNNTNDVVFGSVVSGRPSEIAGVEEMVGLFINTVPVRVTYKDRDTIGDVLLEVQKRAIESEPHHHSPLSEIQASSHLGRKLLDHVMVFENYPLSDELKSSVSDRDHLLDFKITNVEMFEQTNYDLSLMILPGLEIGLRIDYNSHKYEDVIIDRLLAHFCHIISSIVEDTEKRLSDIQILSEEEKHQQLYEFNATAAAYPKDKTLVDLFESQAKRSPDRIALRYYDETLSYRELNDCADKMAGYLIEEYGVRNGDLVGVMLNREKYLIVSIFGILKAGCAYVPIDEGFPATRINSIIEDSGLKVLVSRGPRPFEDNGADFRLLNLDTEIEAIANQKRISLVKDLTSHDLAYVIYTSGSTGKPKGVMIEHHTVVNRLYWMQKEYPITEKDVLLQKTPVVFDVSVWELFWWSFTGASLCLLKPEGEKEPEEIILAIEKYKITTLHFVPSMLGAFLWSIGENCEALTSLRQVFASGEALKVSQVNLFSERVYKKCNTRLINLYGPTEATVDVSFYECDFGNDVTTVPIGKPISNISLYVFDTYRRLVPIGIPGELYIAGGLARGYLNNEELTAEKFTENPYIQNEKIYGTGDLVRLMPDGNIEYLERIDHQVKIRGFRIEPGEIEHQLNLHSQIRESLVVVNQKEEEKYLTAYFIADCAIEPVELKSFLKERLPDYMVPVYYIQIKTFPLTSNGKLDKGRLPEPQMMTSPDYIPPSNDLEEKIVAIWSEILKIDKQRISTDKSFFELGGHSITAIYLANLIEQKLLVRIELRKIFENPSVEKMSEFIGSIAGSNIIAIPKVEEKAYYVTSPAQERLFFQQLLNRDNLAYNISGAFEIKGDIDIERLKESFLLLIQRHEALRTNFMLLDESIIQKIHAESEFELVILDRNSDEHFEDFFAAFVRPFNLSIDSLIRIGLLMDNEMGNILLIDIHHIICDGISLNILMNDLKDIYQNKNLSKIELRYVDYACWQKNTADLMIAQKEYWMGKLSGEISIIDLPVVQDRGLSDLYPASLRLLEIDAELYQDVKRFVAASNVSDFMFLISIYYLLLSKMSGSLDIVIGTDVVGRTRSELKNIVGNFVNLLPLRLEVNNNKTYLEFLSEVKECVLSAFDQQDFQFDQMVSLISREKDMSKNPIVQVHFAFSNFMDQQVESKGFEIVPLKPLRKMTTQYEFKLEVMEKDGQFSIAFVYSSDLYEDSFIEVMMDQYLKILIDVLKDPSVKIDGIN